jgi:hypothetical protein
VGREPGLSGVPPGIAKRHEVIPFRVALRRGLVIVEPFSFISRAIATVPPAPDDVEDLDAPGDVVVF